MIRLRRFTGATRSHAQSAKDTFMGNGNPQTREAMSRLALSCSALARAGQVLSMVTDPAKTDEALRQATAILESDAKASRLPQMEAVVAECQSALSAVAMTERVAECRKLATRMARLASTLATEVQEQTRKAGKVEAKPAAAAPGAPVIAPTVAPATAAKTEKRPSRPKVDITPIRVAATAEERAAVTAALETGERFADVKNGTLVDTRLNLMWSAKIGPAVVHRAAVAYATSCRLGGYADWRLPRPDELQHFLTGGGRDLPAMFRIESGSSAVALWTSETSRRFLFLRQATAVQVRSAAAQPVSAGQGNVHLLVVRGAPGSR
jgi:predicted phage tail protein